jgi:glycosyltransferase involved in cell wall biosynthesis
MPTVGVIIPTHNRANYLPVAISSVLNQSFQDFEILVVDDGSTDSTAAVVAGFSDQRMKYIRHETSKGGSAARNTGIRNSNCPFIAFLDDDDEWLPSKLQLLIDLLKSSPTEVGAAYSGYWIVDRSTGKICGKKTPAKRGDLSQQLLAGNCIGGTSAVVARSECFERVGMFDEDLPSFQDYDLWIRISKDFQFEFIPHPLSNYYVHENKIWTDSSALSRGMEIFLRKHGNSTPLRKYFSYRYLALGVRHCENNHTRDARGAFLKAISLYPFEVRHYFNLVLSLLGAEAFKRIKGAKRWLPLSTTW